jgi:hypothetical protein
VIPTSANMLALAVMLVVSFLHMTSSTLVHNRQATSSGAALDASMVETSLRKLLTESFAEPDRVGV